MHLTGDYFDNDQKADADNAADDGEDVSDNINAYQFNLVEDEHDDQYDI